MAKKRKAKRKTVNAAQKAVQAAKRSQTVQPHSDNPSSLDTHSAPLTVNSDTTKSVLYSLRVDAPLRDRFNECCRQQDTSGSQVLRRYMRSFISKYEGAAQHSAAKEEA